MQSNLGSAKEWIAGFAGKRILVIGDLMLDEFIWGNVSRISPEAPVPVVDVTGESYYPGGAANVARNVREFTADVAVMGTDGDRPPGTPSAPSSGGERHRYFRGAARPGVYDNREDQNRGPEPAGGARGPGARTAVAGGRYRMVETAPGPRDWRRGRLDCGRLRQRLSHATAGRLHLRQRRPVRQGPDRRSAPAHLAQMEPRDGHQTQPQGSIFGLGVAPHRSRGAGFGR